MLIRLFCCTPFLKNVKLQTSSFIMWYIIVKHKRKTNSVWTHGQSNLWWALFSRNNRYIHCMCVSMCTYQQIHSSRQPNGALGDCRHSLEGGFWQWVVHQEQLPVTVTTVTVCNSSQNVIVDHRRESETMLLSHTLHALQGEYVSYDDK